MNLRVGVWGLFFFLLAFGAFPQNGFNLATVEELNTRDRKNLSREELDYLAKYELHLAETLYLEADYIKCREMLDEYIFQAENRPGYFPPRILAKIYRLRAYVSFAFREDGFRAEIESYFFKAIELDMDLDAGNPEEIPPALITLFNEVKKKYLDRYSRTAKRHRIGLFGSVVMETTILDNPFILQPGFHYGFNLNDIFTLCLDMEFPMTLPLYDSISGQVGLIWFPTYRVEQLAIGISSYYNFQIENLAAYTHSISLNGHAEFIFRFGLGLAISAELFRVYQVLGVKDVADISQDNSLNLLDKTFFRVNFANITFYVFYTF